MVGRDGKGRRRWADFVLVQVDLHVHPCVVALARHLEERQTDAEQIVAHLWRSRGAHVALSGAVVLLWAQADKRCDENDVVRGVTPAWVDHLTGIEGLGEVLDKAAPDWFKWVDGGLQFVSYQAHNGPAAKARFLKAARQNKYRTNSGADVAREWRKRGARVARSVSEYPMNIEEIPPNPPCTARGESGDALDGAAAQARRAVRVRGETRRERRTREERELATRLEQIRTDPRNAALLNGRKAGGA